MTKRARLARCGGALGIVAALAVCGAEAATTATGFTVNGAAMASGSALSTAGAVYRISGAANGYLDVTENCIVELENVTWTAAVENHDLLYITPGKNVELRLYGENSMADGGKQYMTAIFVGEGSTLDITNCTDDASLTLTMTKNGNACIGGSINDIGTSGTINIWGGKIAAQSGKKGAGIGGYKAPNGTINIYGGTINATGGERSAGIGGGGYDSDEKGFDSYGGTINIYGGDITANGGKCGAGIGGGYKGEGGRISIYGGTINAIGGALGAGIGGGDKNSGGTINVYGGSITAKTTGTGSSEGGAGIGGGYDGDGGFLNVYGGLIVVTNACRAAALGGGNDGNGGVVKVYGGVIYARGASHAAAIGGGSDGKAGEFYNYGGTVFAEAGRQDVGKVYEGDIGKGSTKSDGAADYEMPFVLLGGSTRLKYGKATGYYGMAAPTAGVASDGGGDAPGVYLATIEGLAPNALCEFAGLGEYGQNTIQSDESGKVYLWLPNGVYSFEDDDCSYSVTIDGAAASVVRTEKDKSTGGAGSMRRKEYETLSDGRRIVVLADGDLGVKGMSFSDNAFGGASGGDAGGGGDGDEPPRKMALSIHAPLTDGSDFADWVAATKSAGKFKVYKAYTIPGLDDAETRMTLEISDATVIDKDAYTLLLDCLLGDDRDAPTAFFKIAVED